MSETPTDKTDWGKLLKEGAIVGTVFAVINLGVKKFFNRDDNE